MLSELLLRVRSGVQTLLGAIVFYTCLPLPARWYPKFEGIARWAPMVGLAIGGLLGLTDSGLVALGMAPLSRSALIVVSWLAITGGLHLDGAMDTADGLAVLDPERRLEVMADSRSGAFGVMAAVSILLLKTAALSDLTAHRPLLLMLAAGWGRWGQLVAIARYPYLKPEGKGAFHKAAIRSTQEALTPLLWLLGIPILANGFQELWLTAGMTIAGVAIALLSGAFFNQRLGGHTGDSYGAVVEWTEALFLCVMAIVASGKG